MIGPRIQTRDLAPDDQTLLAQVAQGNSRALEILYERHARVVYGVALRIVGAADLAEDIVQETFWRVWRRSRTLQPGRGQVAAWIFGIARNLSIDELRRQRARGAPGNYAATLPDVVDEQMDVVGASLDSERRRLINQALQQIPPEQREAIELAYFGGLSQSEIADRLDSPLGTVKTRIRLGLRRLRDLLARDVRAEEI
jgi:RNA polymerase sigma-70 factor, ECF subfamily